MNCNIKQNNQHTNKSKNKTKHKTTKKVLFGEGSTKKKERNKKSHLKVDNKYWKIPLICETIYEKLNFAKFICNE